MKPVCPDSISFDVPTPSAEALDELLTTGNFGLEILSSAAASNENAVIEHAGATPQPEPLGASLSYSSSGSTLHSLGTNPGHNSQNHSHQQPQRRYPQEAYNGPTNGHSVKAVSKWVQWCVGSKRTRAWDICVEGLPGPKRGRQFLQELKKTYRTLRGFRYWLSLTTLAGVKVVKV